MKKLQTISESLKTKLAKVNESDDESYPDKAKVTKTSIRFEALTQEQSTALLEAFGEAFDENDLEIDLRRAKANTVLAQNSR